MKYYILSDRLNNAAAFSVEPLVVRALSRQFKSVRTTGRKYLSAKKAMYRIDRVPAWEKKDYDRPGKTPKFFVTDTGLMASLLGVTDSAEKA